MSLSASASALQNPASSSTGSTPGWPSSLDMERLVVRSVRKRGSSGALAMLSSRMRILLRESSESWATSARLRAPKTPENGPLAAIMAGVGR